MKKLVSIIFLVFLCQPAWANPCLILNGLKDSSQFLSLVKAIAPNADQFERLQSCWEKIELRNGATDEIRQVTSRLEKYFKSANVDLTERKNAFPVLEELERVINDVSETFNRKAVDNVISVLITKHHFSNESSFQIDLFETYRFQMDKLRNAFEGRITPEMAMLFKRVNVADPVNFIADEFRQPMDLYYENKIFDSFAKFSEFEVIPYLPEYKEYRLNVFSRDRFNKFFKEVYPTLSPVQKQSIVTRIIKSHPYFPEVLDGSHSLLVLKGIADLSDRLPTKRMVELMEAFKQNMPLTFVNKAQYEILKAAMTKLAFNNEAMEHEALSYLKPSDRRAIHHEIVLFQKSQQESTVSLDNISQFVATDCNILLKAFTNRHLN